MTAMTGRPLGCLLGVTLLAVGAIGSPDPAAAQPGEEGMPRPIQVRVDGFVGDPPADPAPMATWTLSIRGTIYPFQVLNLVILQGDTSKDQLISAMEPYAPVVTYFVHGPGDLLGRIAAMPRNQPFSLWGFTRMGERQFDVTGVGPVPGQPRVTPSPPVRPPAQ